MRKRRRSEHEILQILREAAHAESLAEVVRRHGINARTYYRWKARYGGEPAERLSSARLLLEENGRLKRLVADQLLEIEALKDLLQRRSGGARPVSLVRGARRG